MTTTIEELTSWFTAPGWTTAHNLEIELIHDARRYWRTLCGRRYPSPDGGYSDPTQAPPHQPRCRRCLKVDAAWTCQR